MANEQAKAFVDQATQSLQNSQFQQALDLVDQAIAIEPGASDSQVLRGICLSQLGQPDAATDAFRKAIMLSPYNAKAYYNLAVHYNALGNKKEAHELAREAVGVDPRHAAAKALLLQLEGELARPVPPQVGEDTSSMYDPSGPQPGAQAKPTSPAPQDAPPPARPSNQDLPPPASSDMPHVSAAPGQPRQTAQSAPSNNPYAPGAGSAFSPQGYQRAGYDQSAHSLPWVENMGAGWTAVGWVLSGMSFAMMVIIVVLYMTTFQAAFSGGSSAAVQAQLSKVTGSGLYIAEAAVRLVILLWILCDVLDRRAGWGWVVGLVVFGCCCPFAWIVLPIYLLAGRKII